MSLFLSEDNDELDVLLFEVELTSGLVSDFELIELFAANSKTSFSKSAGSFYFFINIKKILKNCCLNSKQFYLLQTKIELFP